MASSSRTPLLALLAVGVLAIVGAAVFLLEDDGASSTVSLGADAAPASAAPDVTLPDPLAHAPDVSPLAGGAAGLAAAAGAGEVAERRRTLRGRIVRLADGSPLSGWTLTAPYEAVVAMSDPEERARADGFSTTVATLDEDGRFVLDNMAESIDRLDVQRRPPSLRETTTFELPLPPEPWREELELVADTGWVITGRLLSTTGAPLENAFVRTQGSDGALIVPPPSQQPELFEGAQPDGRFRLVDVLPSIGRYERGNPRPISEARTKLIARAALHLRRELSLELTDTSRRLDGVDIVLESAGAIEGRVMGADGVAAPWLSLSLPLRIEPSRLIAPDDIPGSGKKGLARARVPGDEITEEELALGELPTHYRIDHVPEGRYVLRLVPGIAAQVQSIDVDSARSLATLFFSSADDVQAAEEAEVAKARGEVVPAPTRPIELAPPEVWVQEVDVRAGQVTRLDLRMPWGGVLAGRVRGAGGAPIEGAKLSVSRELEWELGPAEESELRRATIGKLVLLHDLDPAGSRARVQAGTAQARTDETGAFVLGRLPEGELTLTVKPPAGSGLVSVSQVLDFGEAERREGFDILLPRGRSLAGRVLAEDGSSLSRPWVRLVTRDFQSGESTHAELTPDADGRFLFGGLGEEAYQLLAGAKGHAIAVREVSLGDGPVELFLAKGHDLEGFVTDATTGAPVRVFTLTLESETWRQSRRFNRENGRFSVEGLGPEPFELSVSADGYRTELRPDVLPERDLGASLDLRLQPGG